MSRGLDADGLVFHQTNTSIGESNRPHTLALWYHYLATEEARIELTQDGFRLAGQASLTIQPGEG